MAKEDSLAIDLSPKLDDRVIPLGGGRVHFTARGPQDAALTLAGLNGIAGGADSFWPLLGGVPESVRVLLPDLPGCGGSEPLRGAHTVQAYTDWLGRFLDEQGAGRVVLISVTTGVPMAVRFARQYPARTAGLICCLPFLGRAALPRWMRPVAAYAGRVPALRDLVDAIRQNDVRIHRIIPSTPPEAIPALAERDIHHKQEASLRAAGELLHDLMLMDSRTELRDLHTPMLFLAAEHDPFSPLPPLQGIVRGHPERRLSVAAAGHSWNEPFIARMNAEIAAFLARLD